MRPARTPTPCPSLLTLWTKLVDHSGTAHWTCGVAAGRWSWHQKQDQRELSPSAKGSGSSVWCTLVAVMPPPRSPTSDVGLGAVLSQEGAGGEIVVAYYTRSLSCPERNYCVTQREPLPLRPALPPTDGSAFKWPVGLRPCRITISMSSTEHGACTIKQSCGPLNLPRQRQEQAGRQQKRGYDLRCQGRSFAPGGGCGSTTQPGKGSLSLTDHPVGETL